MKWKKKMNEEILYDKEQNEIKINEEEKQEKILYENEQNEMEKFEKRK